MANVIEYKGDPYFNIDGTSLDFFKCGINVLKLELIFNFIQVLTNTYNIKTKHHGKLKAL